MRLRVRGYNKAEQSWVYGSLTEDCFEDRYYILGDSHNMAGFCKVETETISEYSGFCDEFGNPLYMGDKAVLYTKLTCKHARYIKSEEGFINYSKRRGCWEFFVPNEHGFNKKYPLYKVARNLNNHHRTIYDNMIQKWSREND